MNIQIKNTFARSFFILVSILLFTTTSAQEKKEEQAMSGEIVLKLHVCKREPGLETHPLIIMEREDLTYKTIEKPEGVTAPKGELQWGKVILGEKSYLVCIEKDGQKFTKLYLDRNGNKNLAEETPISCEKNGRSFVLENLPAAFEFKGSLLELDMKLEIIPQFDDGLLVYTVYAGTIKTELGEFEVAWMPGEYPNIRPVKEQDIFHCFVVGKKKLSIDISLKDSKPQASYAVTEEGLVPVEAPSSLYMVQAIHDEPPKFSITKCLPKDGKFFLPKGKYDGIACLFKKKKADVEYILSLYLPKSQLEVKEVMKIGKVEPLTLTPEVIQKGGAVSIGVLLKSAAGQKAGISREDGIVKPKLSVKDPEGKEVASYEYQPG